MFIFFLCFQKILCDCSFKSNLISIADETSLEDLKDEYRPLFLRLTSPGCPYSPASQVHWEAAADLFPQVDFVTIDCWKNTKICSLFGDAINTPYHGFVLANTSEVYDNEDTKFGRPSGVNNIEESPTKFIDVITKYAHLYPISPPLANLVPMTTDSFYKNAEDPIILLYNSQCSEEVPFLNAWSKAANEELISNSDHSTIGLLDCSKYPDECQRWSRPYVVRTPRALIYSKKTGNFEILEKYDEITKDKIQYLLTNANSQSNRPTPTPVPNPIPETPTLAPEDYEILENSDLQNRKISEVKSKYVNQFKSPEGGPCLNGCGEEVVESTTCVDIPPNPKDHESALNVVNMFRWLAGLPDDVTESQEWSDACAKTAYNIHRTAKIPEDHVINDKYLNAEYCGESSNKQVALDSLLSGNAASCFDSTHKLFKDEGSNNDGVVGHRRFLLHPDLKKVGFGFYPFKLKHISGNLYQQRPAVNLLRFKENENVKYIENGVPSNLNFVSWPPAGPFPIDHLPSNWHISHPMFKSAELSDLEILVTRDDGIELPITRSVIEKYNVNKDALILIMSKEALSRCQVMHKINVFVKNNKDKKFIRYSFELFDANDYTEVCFYNNDQSKCPSTVANENKFGKDKYDTAEVLSKATNAVKINVVEPITLSKELTFSAKQKFVVTGNKITGTVCVYDGTVVDFQDPTETDFTLRWNVGTKAVGKIETGLKAKSIYVQVMNPTEQATLDNIVFYTGRETQCSLSMSVHRGTEKDVYFTFGGSNYQYVLISSPSAAYENFIIGDAFSFYPELEPDYPGTKLSTLNEMKNQKSYKRVVRIFINPAQADYITIDAFIPGVKKDYHFVKTGNAYQFFSFFCDYDIREVANSITFEDLSDRFDIPLQPYSFNLIKYYKEYSRQRCEIDNITIRNSNFRNFLSTDIFFPYVNGDDAAKAQYPGVYVDTCEADEQNPSVFDTQRRYSSQVTQANVEIDGSKDEYIIKVDFKGLLQGSTLYKYITITPKKGAESKHYKFTFADRDNANDNYPISNDDFPIVYFENFQDISINHPVSKDGTNYLSKFQFLKCGKVSFADSGSQDPIDLGNKYVLSSSSENYGAPVKVNELSADGSGTYHVPNFEAKKLTVSAQQQEFVEVKVTEEVSVDSSSLVLNKCELSENIKIVIKKTKSDWPSISLDQTELKASMISIDLNIKNDAASLLDDQSEIPYEEHLMVVGIESGCQSLLDGVVISNNGNFEKRCSTDDKNLIVARGEQPKYEEIIEDSKEPVVPPPGGDGEVVPPGGDDGSNEPVVPPPGGDGENVPPGGDDGSKDPDVPPGGDDGSNEPVAPPPGGDGENVPPGGDDGSKDPDVPPGGDDGSNEPVAPPPGGGGGSNVVVVPAPGDNPNDPGKENEGKKSFPVGGIVGIVVGVVVVIAVVVVVVIVVMKKKNATLTSDVEGNIQNEENDVGL